MIPTRNPEIRIIEKPDYIETTAEFGVSKPVNQNLFPIDMNFTVRILPLPYKGAMVA